MGRHGVLAFVAKDPDVFKGIGWKISKCRCGDWRIAWQHMSDMARAKHC